MSLSVAKNAMHRAIDELFCRQLTQKEKDQIWKYFKSRCAYCDKRINRKLRHGHMDHLDCSANSGGNYIRNRVLACKECNGNEKREQDWQEFLKSKCADYETFLKRHKRITHWQSQFSLRPPLTLSAAVEAAKEELISSIQNFEIAFVHLRSLIRTASNLPASNKLPASGLITHEEEIASDPATWSEWLNEARNVRAELPLTSDSIEILRELREVRSRR